MIGFRTLLVMGLIGINIAVYNMPGISNIEAFFITFGVELPFVAIMVLIGQDK